MNEEKNQIQFLLKDFIQNQSYIGSMFADEEGCGWTYLGQTTSGKAMCRMDNSSIVQELSLDTVIKWVF